MHTRLSIRMRPLAGAKTMPSLFAAEPALGGGDARKRPQKNGGEHDHQAAHDPEERHAEHEQARDGARGDDFAHGVRGVKARHEGMPRLISSCAP